MYTLTNIEGYQEAVKVLELFDSTLKFFWIDKLNLSNSIKGKLIIYFNL